jgi:tetratricopeptide (TPR) repeat protein
VRRGRAALAALPLAALGALGVGALAGCAPALRAPRPVTELAGPGAATAAAAERLAESERQWARRPDAGAVRASLAAALDAARPETSGTAGLVAACRAAAWLVEREKDARARADLIAREVEAAQWCGRRAPAAAACDYALAIALGQQARERPSTAADGLAKMVAALRRAAAAEPALDEGGPYRVLALVLLRAPGWPAGPGDPEEGLEQAERAVAQAADAPANQLALGEALRANGRQKEALEAFEKARDLAARRAAAGDPDAPGWQQEAARELAKR